MKFSTYTLSLLSSLCFLAMSLLSNPLHAQEDAIIKHFSKYVEQDGFTSIYISPRMFKMLGARNKDTDDPKMKKTIEQLGGLRMLSSDSVDGVSLYKEIFNTLNKDAYEELMTVRESDSDVKFLIKGEEENKVSELLMLIGGKNNFFMLSIVGVNLDLDSVMDIANDFEPKEEEEEKKE